MKAYLAYAIVLLIAIALSIQPVFAITQQAIPFINSCDFIFMVPTEYSNLFVAEFNSVSTIDSSLETLNIDFPAFDDGIHTGPLTGMANVDGPPGKIQGSANVLPFGLVDLAFPSVSQTVNDTHAYQRTYFFTDSSNGNI